MADNGLRLASIGAGNMAKALVGGIVEAGLAKAEDCVATDIFPEARAAFTEATGVEAINDNNAAVARADVVLLAVKPQALGDVLAGLSSGDGLSDRLFISIVAGVTASTIESALGAGIRVVRTMPNTPALLGCGAAGVAPGANATADDVALTLRLLNAVGVAVEVEEPMIDVVTAVSGSGPAYFFYFVEHLIAAGVEQGLSEEVAGVLAKQTALGAARMLTERPNTPEELRVAVTSKGGTTAAALKAFEDGDFKDLVSKAVNAAADRGRELGAG